MKHEISFLITETEISFSHFGFGKAEIESQAEISAEIEYLTEMSPKMEIWQKFQPNLTKISNITGNLKIKY